jgi:glycosyltransferase involved in cell wall biosynthesis
VVGFVDAEIQKLAGHKNADTIRTDKRPSREEIARLREAVADMFAARGADTMSAMHHTGQQWWSRLSSDRLTVKHPFSILAEALGVASRVALVGARPDVPRYLAAADVLAAPSRNEGMGRALVEAMALGLPVVATSVGGIPAVVVDGECGRLVPAGDPAALATALAELGRDATLAAKLGDAAVHRAERFATPVTDARLLTLYARLTREKGLA